ncbi:MAG: hypothetical protein OEM52_03980 [bacterium]|nr:hypothetical protein [bacterium]
MLNKNCGTGFYLDIGTQTTLWLVADLFNHIVYPLERGYWTNSFGLSALESGEIPEEIIREEIARIQTKLQEQKSQYNIEFTLAAGTAALRNAPNGKEFLVRLHNSTNLSTRLFSPQQEARAAWLGAHSREQRSTVKILLDLGGGSTEIIWQNDAKEIVTRSLPIGASILTKRCVTTDPPGELAFRRITEYASPIFKRLRVQLPETRTIMVTGGTATALGSIQLSLDRYDPEQIIAKFLTVHQLKKQMELLLSTNELQRFAIPGMPPDRTKVLPAGSALLFLLMEVFGWNRFFPQDRGVLFGLPYYVKDTHE